MAIQRGAESVTASLVVTDDNDNTASDTVTGVEDDKAGRADTPGEAQDATPTEDGDAAAGIQNPGRADATPSSHPEDTLVDTADVGASVLAKGRDDASAVVFEDAAPIVPSELGETR